MATLKTKQARQTVQKALEARDSEPLIGGQVMWTLEGACIKVDDLKKLFAKYGLDEEWFPPATEGSVAFNKAINETRKQGKAPGYMIRPVLEGEDFIIKAIVREDAEKIKAKAKWEGDEEVQIKFDKKNNTVTASKAHPVAQAIKDLYKTSLDTFLVTDFIKMLTRNMHRMGAVSLRSKGGVYFVPPTYMDVLTKHEKVINDLGGPDFTLFRLYGDAQNMATTGRKVKKGLAEELADLEKQLAEWAAEGPPREDTMKRRLDDYKALKAKAEMYAGMLEIKVDDIQNGVQVCTKQLMALLGVVRVEKGKKEEEKAAKRAAKKTGSESAGKKAAETRKRNLEAAQTPAPKPLKVEEEVAQAAKPRTASKPPAKGNGKPAPKAQPAPASKKVLVVKRDKQGREVAM